MRLYLKLLAMVAITWGAHRCVLNDWRRSELLFGVRCLYAQTMEDRKMLDGLVDEAKRYAENDAMLVFAAGGGSRGRK